MAQFEKIDSPYKFKEFWSKYPHGYTIFEALLDWVKQTNDLTDNVNDWNTYLQGFVAQFDENLQAEVIARVQQWIDDGTIAVIISDALQTDIDQVDADLQSTKLTISQDIAKLSPDNIPLNPLFKILNEKNRSVAIQVYSDSTADGVSDWAYKLLAKIGNDYPEYTVQSRLWDDVSHNFNLPATLQIGTAGAMFLDCSTGPTTRKISHAGVKPLSGIIDITLKFSTLDWTPASAKTYISKTGVDGNRGWYIGLQINTGRPTFTFSTDGLGGTLEEMVVIGSPVISDGLTTYLRWVFTPNNGAGGHSLEVYQSTDMMSWTQLGSTLTVAGVVSIFPSTAPLELGGAGSGVSDATAKIYEVYIRDGRNGQTIAPVLPDMWEPFNENAVQVVGAPVLTLVNASRSGGTIDYLTEADRIKKMTPNFGQALVFVSVSHNEGTTFSTSYLALFHQMVTKAKDMNPYAQLVIVVQNPEYVGTPHYIEHGKRRLDMLAYAHTQKLDLIDIHQVFVDYGAWIADLMADPVHPNALGGTLWADTVYQKIK